MGGRFYLKSGVKGVVPQTQHPKTQHPKMKFQSQSQRKAVMAALRYRGTQNALMKLKKADTTAKVNIWAREHRDELKRSGLIFSAAVAIPAPILSVFGLTAFKVGKTRLASKKAETLIKEKDVIMADLILNKGFTKDQAELIVEGRIAELETRAERRRATIRSQDPAIIDV